MKWRKTVRWVEKFVVINPSILKSKKNLKGDTFEWEETEEVRKAVERLHQTIRELESQAPDYGVGK